MSKELLIISVALIGFGASSLLLRTGTPSFKCVGIGGGSGTYIMQREEHGFPLTFVKRSVSVSSCSPLNPVTSNRNVPVDFGNDLASPTYKPFYLTDPDSRHEQYGSGYIIIINLFADMVFWLTASCVTVIIYEKIRTRRKHGA